MSRQDSEKEIERRVAATLKRLLAKPPHPKSVAKAKASKHLDGWA